MKSFFRAEGLQNYMADQQRLQVSELQFDKFTTPWTLSCWKIRFKTQVSSCSGSPLEAKVWINELEMVDLKSPRSIKGYTQFPSFDTLDARTASALNKIIQNSYFKKKVSLEEQNGRQIAYMIYDYFQVTGTHDTVLDYADLFTITGWSDSKWSLLVVWGWCGFTQHKVAD